MGKLGCCIRKYIDSSLDIIGKVERLKISIIYIYIFGKLRIMKLRFTQYPAITVNCDGVYCPLIYMEGSDKGVIKDYAEWLEDLED